ncbi:MAG TPA: hypothetical protein VJ598_07545 [Albitalea sp.]|nr:hypothetical protein [Albitalea sp.]
MSIEHDAWLREALRHAPDAQLGPPPSLSEAILREARAKARPSARVSTPVAWWRWLARPPVAAGFASVMVAVLVGLMWREGPPEEAAPMAPPPSAPVAAPPVPAAPVATPAPAPEVRAEAKTAPMRSPKAAAPRQRVAREAAAPAPTAAPPVVAAAPAPAPAAQAQRRAAPLAQERADNAPAVATAGALADARSAGPIESLRRTIASEPQRWTWQRDGGEPRPWNDAIAAWLAQLDAATTAGWQPAAAPDRAPLAELRLLRDGQLLHSWRIDSDGVRWNANRTATLSPAALDALRASLAQAAR